ncbi:MAG: hypothetical protein HC910_17170 [Spirulinaceae cyanobacterium SM2_1_0]|nr:hypothetical protein [Spirulinaceae cyanobacterium SM2_1_0]
MLSELQKQAAKAIVNSFETGSLRGDYSNVTSIPSDPGGLTYGRSQTTLNSGNLYLLIAAYADAAGEFSEELRPYLPRLERQDSRLNRDRRLRRLLEEAGEDPVMQDTQDRFFDSVYWQPTQKSADYIGAQTALGLAIIYDSRIHGSWHMLRDRINRNHGPLNRISEATWMRRYVETRRSWLANHRIRILNKTVYRMDAFNKLINEGNWELELPFTVRGLRVDTDVLAPTVRSSAEIAPTRVLRLHIPYLSGADVRAVQAALQQAGVQVDLDGIYGQDTAKAVEEFQRQQGMYPDGIVGPATRAALGIDEAGKEETSTSTSPLMAESPTTAPESPTAPSPEPAAAAVLKLTEPPQRGDAVRLIQEALQQAGFPVEADGVFGAGTAEAVRLFQQKRGLTADGIVGSTTRAALAAMRSSPATPKTSQSPRALRLTNPPQRGNDVRLLQAALRTAGERLGTDGVFGAATDRAVKEFQQRQGLLPDGVVGASTRAALGL